MMLSTDWPGSFFDESRESRASTLIRGAGAPPGLRQMSSITARRKCTLSGLGLWLKCARGAVNRGLIFTSSIAVWLREVQIVVNILFSSSSHFSSIVNQRLSLN